MDRDDRYKIIKPKFDDGKVKNFSDIVKVLTKSRIAKDIGVSGRRMDTVIKHTEKFKVEELAAIGRLCELSLMEMLKIAGTNYVMPKGKINDERFENIYLLFRNGKISSFDEIFRYITRAPVVAHLKIKSDKLGMKINKVGKFTVEEFLSVGSLFQLRKEEIFPLIVKSYENQNHIVKRKS